MLRQKDDGNTLPWHMVNASFWTKATQQLFAMNFQRTCGSINPADLLYVRRKNLTAYPTLLFETSQRLISV